MSQRKPHALFEALDRNQIVPYFQPVVELRSGVLTSFEVLARWIHPELGIVMPDHFIPLAEETGCIGELTDCVLKQAFAATAEILPEHVTLAVNISPLQFRDSKLPSELERVAAAGGFPLNRIVLEVTESALLGNIAQARSIAHALKEMGVKLALDDFGTGYSSLRHLQTLPFDELKVDSSFVRAMGLTRESRKIAAAVVGLGQSLGVRTVAEGVETQNQANMLLWLGCDEGQGWLYGRPIPESELPAVLAKDDLRGDDPADGNEFYGPIMPEIEALPTQRLAQLQAIYDGVPVGLCFLDTQIRYLSINRCLAGMYGVPVADHLGRKLEEMYPRRYARVIGFIRRALAGESVRGIEVRDTEAGPNGDPRTLLLSYEPVRDEAGEVVGVSVAVVDISERKRAEEALTEAEDHYRYAVRLNPHVLWTMDANGMNDETGLNVEPTSGWTRLTGQNTGEARGRGWMKALHPDDIAPTEAALEKSLATGEPLDVDYRIQVDGEWHWMRNRGWPRRDSEGRIVRWYGSVEDIHDRKVLMARVAALEDEIRAMRFAESERRQENGEGAGDGLAGRASYRGMESGSMEG